VIATRRQQLGFWLGTLVVFFVLLYVLSPILLPFVGGAVIAYFLAPLVRQLEHWRVRRSLGTVVALVLFLLVMLLVLALLVPLVQLQISELASRTPGLIEAARQRVGEWMEVAQRQLAPEDVQRLRDALGSALADLAGILKGVLQTLLTSGFALANLLSLVFVMPIVAFFMLRDWDRMLAQIDGWLPRQYVATIREQAHLIDETLAGYIRGQLLVCLGVGIWYALALTVVHLEFGLIVGILAGILTFIPYVGFATGFVLALSLAALQFGDFYGIGKVVVVFVIGQVLEANVLSPKLVGDRVHLHPVWVIFALFAFGTIFGFLGVLIAIPLAAVMGVLVRFAHRRYLASPLYDPANQRPADERASR
jgi:predicted PurR-regulated permease PerM